MAGFIFPPHPHKSMRIHPDSIDRLEKEGGWLAQRKYNGSALVAHLHHGEVKLWNRHSEPFTTYKLTPSMVAAFNQLNIDPEREVVLNGELLHTKAKSKITNAQAATNTIVLYDILFLDTILLYKGFAERFAILNQICNAPKVQEKKKRALEVCKADESQIWLSEVFHDEFSYRFYEFYEFDAAKNDKYPEIEGLVCKRAEGSVLKMGNVKYDVDWMIRVRKTKEKVYLF